MAENNNLAALKNVAIGELALRRDALIELSRKIHDNPELGYVEFKAADWLTDFLKSLGYTVETGLADLPTSFRASFGSGKPVIGILAEYDALPELGHACGHNIIATAAVGAALAARKSVKSYGGTLQIIGTPGEEMLGGKVTMARKGVFDGLDVAMIVHPGTHNHVITRALACHQLDVEFTGKAAHAAADPAAGINALDAMILSFNAINALRQQMKSEARIHGIITDGGEAPNIIPAHSAGVFLVRSEDKAYLEVLKEKVLRCFTGAASATGATLVYRWLDNRYDPMRNNHTLARVFYQNMKEIGRRITLEDSSNAFGSTDMGNVSQIVPSIHPSVAIAPEGTAGHSPEFAAAAVSDDGNWGMLDAAKALAMTVIDLLASPEIVEKIRQEFRNGK